MDSEMWRRGGRTFRYRGYEIFYRDEGAGPLLLCVHGFPSASWDWHKLWPQLTRRFRVVAADMIGFGFSAKPRAYAYSLRDQAALHIALLSSLGLTRGHVLAHDYGDSVAQELLARATMDDPSTSAAAAPGAQSFQPLSVCFLNGGLFPEVHRARMVQTLLRSPLGPLLGRLANEASFSRSFAAVFGPQTQPSAHRLIRYIDERRQQRARCVGALQTGRVPLRFINGPEDPVSGRHMAERYRALVPNADVVLLEGIGHYPHLEAPQQVLEAFLAFATKLGEA